MLRLRPRSNRAKRPGDSTAAGCASTDDDLTADLTNQLGEGEVQVVADVFVLLLLVDELVCKKTQRR